jgi:hypothetical protein
LRGVGLYSNDLTVWDFSGQNLADAYFYGSALAGTDFTGADNRGGFDWFGNFTVDFDVAITTNMIFPDGSIAGLVIEDGQRLVIRDDDGGRLMWWGPGAPIAISVLDTAAVREGGVLQLVVEADAWDSVISFEPGILAQLGGALELTFADDVPIASQVGRTLQIFNWTGISPTGHFEIRSPYVWDVSNLYTTGEVRLVAVPEPAAVLIVLIGFLSACCFRSNQLAQKPLMNLER